ncbi:hypothetical protein [Prochlorothrix hollandica]
MVPWVLLQGQESPVCFGLFVLALFNLALFNLALFNLAWFNFADVAQW